MSETEQGVVIGKSRRAPRRALPPQPLTLERAGPWVLNLL